jgi:hypothetical protein
MRYLSVAEMMGYDPAALWSLAWILFFVRIVLGFAVGIDDVMHGFRRPGIDAAQRAREARAIRRANIVVSVLHVIMLAAFAFAVPLIAAN